jgi:fructose-1,6-bisphosphatase/inositol monophosphatase family enzyme/SAM-dependent methyltransferase
MTGESAFPMQGLRPHEEAIIAAVLAAGQQLVAMQSVIHEGGRVEVKTDGTLVTAADYASESTLLAAIRSHAPHPHDILSEESPALPLTPALPIWFVDPLDGTRSYAAGSPDYAVLVSEWVAETPRFSVVYYPAIGQLAVAAAGRAAWSHWKIPPLDGADADPKGVVRVCYMCSPGLRHLVTQSGAAYSEQQVESTRALLDVATGAASAAIVLVCGHKPWDLAALLHLVSAAGGFVSDETGRPVRMLGSEVLSRYIVASRDRLLHTNLTAALSHDNTQSQQGANTMLPIAPNWPDSFFDEGFEETFRRLGKYDHTDEDVMHLLRLVPIPAGGRVLDVPCGWGRHAGRLHALGFTVVGVDRSAAQINRARQTWPEVEFHRRDMRDVPGTGYDAVLNLWTSFGSLPEQADDLAALQQWYAATVEGGHLVMELTTREYAEASNRRSGEEISRKSTTINDVREDAVFDWKNGMSFHTYTRGDWSRTCATRLYSRAELLPMLHAAGYSEIRMYGSFAGGAVRDDARTILTARRM